MAVSNIAIIGAGPAALYAAEALAKSGHHVAILNRDVKPGGLAEYGIYVNKYKMKGGLRAAFAKILALPTVRYFGNVTVGHAGDVSLADLRAMGFDALVVAVGAQGTKWLGLDGETTPGVYHAKDLVYHYNSLPPFSERDFAIGQHACVVGMGNVALDIVHWLTYERKVASVTLVARRGPAEKAYTDKEMKIVGGTLDLDRLRTEFAAIEESVRAVGQDPQALLDEVLAYKASELECETPTRLGMRFLRGPAAIGTDAAGKVTGLVCDVNRLVRKDDGSVGVKTTGEQETIACDTVVFAIGDAIEPSLDLPVDPRSGSFATVSEPWAAHPDRPRYTTVDPQAGRPNWGTFVMGWARKASDGLVGKAKLDALNGCAEVEAYLNGELPGQPGCVPQTAGEPVAALEARLRERHVAFVDLAAVTRLARHEAEIAQQQGLPEFKFKSNEDMLRICRDGASLAVSGS